MDVRGIVTTWLRRALAAAVLALWPAALLLAAPATAQSPSTAKLVTTTEVTGVITPVIADHLADMVELAEDNGSQALVVILDTPGGLVTSMRQIVQSFLEAEVPVVVWVSPRGADAGSAGTYITMAANIAAMAPATTIGAATPVDLQGGEISEKVENNAAAYAETIANERGRNVDFAREAVTKGRSITVVEAVELGVVDFQAGDLEELLDRIDGWEVQLASGDMVTIDTDQARVEEANLSGTRSILQRLADPNLAFIFLSIATLAIIYEIASPGLGAGGAIGVTLIILSMFSLSVLPVNYAGAALMVLSGVLFVLELFMPGIGVAAAAGAVTLVLGGLFLFQRPTGIGIDPIVVLPTAVVVLGLTLLAGRLARRTLRQLPVDNAGGLVGRRVTVQRRGDDLRVHLDGTGWAAACDVELEDGQEVEVTELDGLTLRVLPVAAQPEAPTDQPAI